MPDEESFAALMVRLQAGDPDAAAAVFHRFAGRLIALARARLDTRLRQKVDPEDVLQSVFRSFFLRHADSQFDLAGWDSLWSLLTLMTLRKCGLQTRHFRAACRDVGREVAPAAAADDSGPAWEALAREPTPAEAALLADEVEQLLRGLDARERAIVELNLQGYTIPEISAQLAVAERTAYRLLARLKGKLQKRADDDVPA